MSKFLCKMDSVAWEKGFRSGAQKSFDCCPFPAGTEEAWAWSSGRIEGVASGLNTTGTQASLGRALADIHDYTSRVLDSSELMT